MECYYLLDLCYIAATYRCMFAAAAVRNGATYLGRHLTANDYYSEHEHVIGQWVGEGAALLGLSGRTIQGNDANFEALRRNLHPVSGENLTPRTREDRIAFFDFQVSAPKSVSVMAVTFGDDRLKSAHEASWKFAFSELEKFAAHRARAGGHANSDDYRYTGKLIAAAFTHDASRALDAQLHTHLVCANATYDPTERKWYALQNREMFKAVEYAGRVYQHELATRAIELGYKIREVQENGKVKGWELAGVTDADCDLQSTRRKQIEAKIAQFEAEHGYPPSTPMKHVFATSTRNTKLVEITTVEVRAAQVGKYAPEAVARLTNLRATACAASLELNRTSSNAPDKEASTKDALSSAVAHLAYTNSVFTKMDVLTRALREHPGTVGLGTAKQMLSHCLGASVVELAGPRQQLDPLTPAELQPLTTRENLRLEREATALVRATRDIHPPLAIEPNPSASLSPDQAAAVREICASRDGVIALRGPAGTGKTTTLSELDRLLRGNPDTPVLDIIYVAPTHAAKGVLQSDGFSDATTIARLLTDLQNGKQSLDGRLLVVDEAGMQSTKDGHALLTAALSAGARVLLVGDEKQVPAVEAGDFLSILRTNGGLRTVELSTIFRQRANPEYLEAMQILASGNVKSALSTLADQGRIKESGRQYLSAAAAEYCAITASAQTESPPSSVALVAPTWREIDELNRLVRAELQRRGGLSGPVFKKQTVETSDLSPEERRSVRNYTPGMVISPAGRKIAGLAKGCWHEIVSIERETLKLANGRRINVRELGEKFLIGHRKEIELQVGDRILLQGNSPSAGLTNGMRGIITGKDASGIRFRPIAKGPFAAEEKVIPSTYETLVHGYATTVHASQGETVTTVIGAVGRKISGTLWNVLTSRGRREVSVYVPEMPSIIGAAPTYIENRPAALDYAITSPHMLQNAEGDVRSPLTTSSPIQGPSGKSVGQLSTRLGHQDHKPKAMPERKPILYSVVRLRLLRWKVSQVFHAARLRVVQLMSASPTPASPQPLSPSGSTEAVRPPAPAIRIRR
jgi:conjugative relaxase-like TrwC/TraI family protein